MSLRTAFSPLGGGNKSTGTAYRSIYRARRIPVSGSSIVLRDYASIYSIDLSAESGGTKSYSLDTARIHPANHEVLNFEILVIMPAVNPPKVEFPFVDKWLDFGLFFRNEPGTAYVISVFRIGNKYYAANSGTLKLPTFRPLLGRLEATAAAIDLKDSVTTYRAAVSGETDFTFSTAGLTNAKSVYSFELLLDFDEETALNDVTFPVSGWLDFGMPYRPWRAGTHSLTFISFDGGTNWIGRYNSMIKEA